MITTLGAGEGIWTWRVDVLQVANDGRKMDAGTGVLETVMHSGGYQSRY